MPDLGFLTALALGGGLGVAVLWLVAGLRGTPPAVQGGRPAGRWQQRGAVVVDLVRSGRLLLVAAGAALTLAVTRWPVAAAAIGVLIGCWPQLVGGARAERASIARLEAILVWTQSLRDTVAAHLSLEQAIPLSTARAPMLLRPALNRLAGQIRAQVPLEQALQGLAADLDDPDADPVIGALILAVARRGDRLPQVLSALAASAGESVDLRRRILAGRAGQRREVQIVVAVTVGMAALLTQLPGDFLAPYNSGAGQVALLVVAAIFGVGFWWLARLALTPPGRPFLARPGRPVDPRETRIVAAVAALRPTTAAPAGRETVVGSREHR